MVRLRSSKVTITSVVQTLSWHDPVRHLSSSVDRNVSLTVFILSVHSIYVQRNSGAQVTALSTVRHELFFDKIVGYLTVVEVTLRTCGKNLYVRSFVDKHVIQQYWLGFPKFLNS